MRLSVRSDIDFGELADKFDALVSYDEKLLDSWVAESGYALGSMVTASIATAFMQFSKGFVDVGRLGNGLLIEGGIKGAGKDMLRALSVAGVSGAVVGRTAKLLRITQVGNTCVWQSTANAVRLTGQRWLITAEELAKQAGGNWNQIVAAGRGANDYQLVAGWMQQMGIQLRVLAQGNTMSARQVLQLVRANPGGVVTFSLRFGNQGHRLYAVWSRLGGLVIRDPNFLFRTYRSLADLEKAFGTTLSVSTSPVHFIPNALLIEATGIAESAGGLAGLALQMLPVLPVPAKDPETALQSLMVREATAGLGADAPVPRPVQGPTSAAAAVKTHSVARGDTLSEIAHRYYSNSDKWPVLWYANVRVIGPTRTTSSRASGCSSRTPPMPPSSTPPLSSDASV